MKYNIFKQDKKYLIKKTVHLSNIKLKMLLLLFLLLLLNIFIIKSDDCPLKINSQNQIITFNKLSELNFTQCNITINLNYLKFNPNKHKTIIL